MTLTELKYILALAQEKNFTHAAKRCHVSQPTLSVAINKLEASLGVQIFERQPGNLRITEIGEKLVVQAQHIIESANKFIDIAEGSRHQLDSPLKLGGIYTVAPYIFPLIIPELKKLAPNMPLLIQEEFTQNLKTKLLQGELDAIFIALPFSDPSLVVKSLYQESFVVLMPKNHPLAKKPYIENKDLKNTNTLLLGEKHCMRTDVLNACPDCLNPSSSIQQTMEGASLETLRHMVASGAGITLLPSTATSNQNYSRSLCIKPFKSKNAQRKIALAWRSSFPRTKAIDTIITALNNAKLSTVCPI